MNTGTLARWPGWRRWMWLARACLAGLVLADVWLGRPGPGSSGKHLVLLVGSVLAAATWIAWPPADRVGPWLRMPVVLAGMAGACLTALISPGTGAPVLPLAIGVMAGSSFPVLEAAVVVAGGLITLGVGSLLAASPGFSLLGAYASVIGGLLAGLWRGQFRLRAEQAELAAVQTQRAEQAHIRAQVLDERARIAREIHDILAHTLGGLVVQLDAADALLGDGQDLDGGRRLVGGARRLAVEGLQETRQAIAALRADPVDLPAALAALATGDGQPGQVSYEVRGTPRRLGPEASLTVYRTAQEALANARKHAPGATVAVTLRFDERSAALRVVSGAPPGPPGAPGRPGAPGTLGSSPGEPLAATGGGYGLNGLTERAELLGGTLHAGPDGDGWAVELEVPG